MFRAIHAFWQRHLLKLIITLLLALILLLMIWDGVFVVIRSGERGVLYRLFTGTEMNTVYQEGLHIISPLDRMYVYDTRLQTLVRDFELLTNQGLPITLTVAIRYRPDRTLLPDLHNQVGPDFVERVVIPETEAVLRDHISRYTPEEVFTSQQGLLDTIVLNALEQSEQRYVSVDDVLIKAVRLPEGLREAILQKLVLQEQQYAYAYRLGIASEEAKRLEIEAQGIRNYQAIISETLNEELIRWRGVEATKELAASENSKIVVIGAGKEGLPLILGNDR